MSEIKVVLLGTGGGYGESALVKYGEKEWLIVDSCQNPTTLEILPLSYLNRIGVDYSEVKYIICTHWHSDHIKGLDVVTDKCINAKFVCAMASDKNKFLQYLGFEARPEKGINSASKIFLNCLTILGSRNGRVIPAYTDRLLQADDKKHIQIATLSPSDDVLRKFLSYVYGQIANSHTNEKIIEPTPNQESIALYLKICNHEILLGGDLERDGWLSIMDNSAIIKNADDIEVFKVPHHGSETAYLEPLLKEKCCNAISQMSAFNKGESLLPKLDMLKKYWLVSKELYLTTTSTLRRKKRDHHQEKMIQSINDTIREVPFHYGLIESTYVLDNSTSNEWVTCIDGNAIKVDENFIKGNENL